MPSPFRLFPTLHLSSLATDAQRSDRLSCVLTARFILHLREWEAEGMGNKGRAIDLTLVGTVVAVEDFGADPMALGAMGHGEKPPNNTGSTDIIGAAGGFGRRSLESLEHGYGMV